MVKPTNRFLAKSGKADGQDKSSPPIEPPEWDNWTMQQKCDYLNADPYYIERKRFWKTNGSEAWSEPRTDGPSANERLDNFLTALSRKQVRYSQFSSVPAQWLHIAAEQGYLRASKDGFDFREPFRPMAASGRG